nr:MAG TPA: hypothetical protein [Bacteriophage sp.]
MRSPRSSPRSADSGEWPHSSWPCRSCGGSSTTRRPCASKSSPTTAPR